MTDREKMARDQINDLVKVMEAACSNPLCSITNCDLCRATAIYNAGFRKQREGEWVFADQVRKDDALYYCSHCQAGDVHKKDLFVPYCWNCGAKMKGAEQ